MDAGGAVMRHASRRPDTWWRLELDQHLGDRMLHLGVIGHRVRHGLRRGEQGFPPEVFDGPVNDAVGQTIMDGGDPQHPQAKIASTKGSIPLVPADTARAIWRSGTNASSKNASSLRVARMPSTSQVS
jgi:hypothetical protein